MARYNTFCNYHSLSETKTKRGAKAEILSLINLRHCPRMEKNMMVGELLIRITDVC